MVMALRGVGVHMQLKAGATRAQLAGEQLPVQGLRYAVDGDAPPRLRLRLRRRLSLRLQRGARPPPPSLRCSSADEGTGGVHLFWPGPVWVPVRGRRLEQAWR